jgi:hypothetical protein
MHTSPKMVSKESAVWILKNETATGLPDGLFSNQKSQFG